MPWVKSKRMAWALRAHFMNDNRGLGFRYFRQNAGRMRYFSFWEQGYRIGSGVVEAGCRQVIRQLIRTHCLSLTQREQD